MASSSQASASFFSLPLEIRNQIYHHAFLNTSYKATAPPKFEGFFASPFDFMDQKPALPSVCFASHPTLDEALNVLSDSLTMNILYLYFYDKVLPLNILRDSRIIDEVWLDGRRVDENDDKVQRRHSQRLEECLDQYAEFLNGQLPYDILQKIRPVESRPLKVAVCLSVSFQPAHQKLFDTMGCVTAKGQHDIHTLENTVVTVKAPSGELRDLHKIFEPVRHMRMAGYPGIHWLERMVNRDKDNNYGPRVEDPGRPHEEQRNRIIYFD